MYGTNNDATALCIQTTTAFVECEAHAEAYHSTSYTILPHTTFAATDFILLFMTVASNLVDDKYHKCFYGPESWQCAGYIFAWILGWFLGGAELIVWLLGVAGADLVVFAAYNGYARGYLYIIMIIPMYIWLFAIFLGE